MSTESVYLDSNATTPPLPEVVEAVVRGLREHWPNASSSHAMGQTARQVLAQARGQVARFLNCKPVEVVFTSGATEANHMALRGAVGFNGRHRLVLSAGEHAGVRKLADSLSARAGVALGWIGLTPEGGLDVPQAAELITDDVSLVSVMAANNETGVLMPIGEMARLAHAQGALLHVDATQQVGKLPFDFERCGADLVSVSAHKFGGPKGVGALIVRQGLNWPALFQGSQERGRRGGTENLPGILGMAAAAQSHTLSVEAWMQRATRVGALRDQLEQGLMASVPGTVVYGLGQPRLPNTSYLRFDMLHADAVLQRLEQLGVMASSGAACSSSGQAPSAVLTAMGVPRAEALCAIRLSLSPDTTQAQVQYVLQGLPQALAPLMETPAGRSQQTVSPTGVFA